MKGKYERVGLLAIRGIKYKYIVVEWRIFS